MADKDLLPDAVWSAFLMFFLCITVYFSWLYMFPGAIEKFWIPSGLSGVALWKIPIEEIIWFVSWGAFGGVIYEYWLNVNRYTPLLRKS
jgi:hypothetical protein